MLPLILETIFIVILPLVLLTASPTIYTFRHLIGAVICIYFVIQRKLFSIPSLQQQFKLPPRQPVIQVIIASICVGLMLFVVHHFFPTLIDNMVILLAKGKNYKLFSLVSYPLISVPLQEIIFRWLYFYRIKSVTNNPIIVIGITAIAFGCIHLPFQSPLMVIGTFFLGLWWGHLSLKHNSLVLPIVSHAIIGTTLLWLGL